MELKRCAPVFVRRWRLKSRTIFVVLCVLTVVMMGLLQSNLKTNHEKVKIITNKELKDREHANDDRLTEGREGFRDDLRRLQSLVLVDSKNKRQTTGNKHSERNQRSIVDAHFKLLSGKPSNIDKSEGNRTYQIKEVDSKKNNQSDNYVKDEQKSNHSAKVDVVNKTKHGKYNADENDNEQLMEQLFKLLLKLEKEGVDINEEIRVASGEKVPADKQLPFHPLHYPQKLNFEEIVKTFIENGELPKNSINKWKYTPIINPSSKCENSKNGVFVLYMVKTRPDNFAKRKTIRKTWADEHRFPNIRTVFSIGIPRDSNIIKQIKQESLKYKDVLLMDYMDTYKNLTLKTTSGINWAVAHCNVAEFVVSVDDDMYVATDFLIQHLKDMPQAESERLYHGHLYHNTEPVRYGKKDAWESKWIVTREEYPFDTYPDYIFGGFVVMSMRTVLEMSLAIPYTQPISMEDVYLGIVASRLGIVATNTDLVDYYITYSNTEKFKTLIASHYYTSSHMLKKAWECHLSMVKNDVEKSVFCLYLKTELQQLKRKVEEILDWVDFSNNAL
ncbi:lactosylceramide 1,3-N-acetyl-beta-D-glucosaminyltransferase B-like [Ylistrum balloti]|uniref:lactosylceramide 1,3-N-acetyl-beta-D-glucosaminyltransferase B-like n=1 Tax=Ylistrum balloti TaxID=509963 RepID=UPI002905A5DF|nr:lactosylceramide 1,3-N-acetyl-beta-D-glucosaminyltransferase B-like [Ylistrum balloti]